MQNIWRRVVHRSPSINYLEPNQMVAPSQFESITCRHYDIITYGSILDRVKCSAQWVRTETRSSLQVEYTNTLKTHVCAQQGFPCIEIASEVSLFRECQVLLISNMQGVDGKWEMGRKLRSLSLTNFLFLCFLKLLFYVFSILFREMYTPYLSCTKYRYHSLPVVVVRLHQLVHCFLSYLSAFCYSLIPHRGKEIRPESSK